MLGWLRRRRLRRTRELALTRTQAMAARPIRNPTLKWHENDEGVVVVILPRRDDLWGKLLSWLFMVPESRPVSLDQVGSAVWHLCDGEHSVHDIARVLSETHKITMREAEVSLAEFLRMLGRRGMVALALPKEVADELSEEQRRALGVVEPRAEEEAEESEEASRTGEKGGKPSRKRRKRKSRRTRPEPDSKESDGSTPSSAGETEEDNGDSQH
ncbi:MAG: PqqD family protein [Armatimonadetes bacterium]|nr:PqqD family protein [Armatimonadota bacterium]